MVIGLCGYEVVRLYGYGVVGYVIVAAPQVMRWDMVTAAAAAKKPQSGGTTITACKRSAACGDNTTHITAA